jgi:hypothetical protein
MRRFASGIRLAAWAGAVFAASAAAGCFDVSGYQLRPSDGTGGAAGAGGYVTGNGGRSGGAGGSVGGAGGSVGGAGGAVCKSNGTSCANSTECCSGICFIDGCKPPSVTGGTGGMSDSGGYAAGGTDSGADSGLGGQLGGMGGMGAGGTGGGPNPLDTCEGKTPQRPLPYVVGTDFVYPNDMATTAIPVLRWLPLPNPDCFGSFPNGAPPEFVGPDSGTDDAGAPDANGNSSTDASLSTDAAINDATMGDGSHTIPACWGFYYNPDACAKYVVDSGGTVPLWQCWAGATFETSPFGNGATDPSTLPGICIASGATSIEFWARASRDGANVKFGSTRAGIQVTEQWLAIDTTWKKYAIPVATDYRWNSSSQYGVFNGFSVVTEPQDHTGGTYIYVSDMTWVGPGGTTVAACSPAMVTVPFNVTDKYSPGATNGVWGNWGSVKIAACTTRGTGTPAGKCNTLTYAYDAAVGSDCTGVAIVAPAVSCAWTTVAWHVSAPGLCIGPGATKITFQAWGSGAVKFVGAGVILPATLNATPRQYTIGIWASGYAASAQESGFAVQFDAANTGTTVNVDDIKWVQ